MELSKPGQTAAFQTSITPPQIPQSDNQFPIFTPTNWSLLQNRPNLPNPNSLPIRPLAPSRILMPWESPLQPVQSLHQHQLRPNVQNTPQITKISPKSSTPKGLSKQVSNKRPIQQIESAQKSQNSQVIESVRSKLRESLASALSVPTGPKSTGDENNSASNNISSENKSNKEEQSNDSASIVDELLQGNGLCWAPDSILLPQNPKNPLQNPQTLAFKIESELFRLFNGITKKYKEKGRSLLFNLKDPSNPKLRERVLNSEITPDKLCSMSAEELASEELSEWRQAKAEEMDKMIVLPDESTENRKRVKKTHKGEFVVLEEEKDGDNLEAEIKATTAVSTRLVEKDKEKEKSEGKNENGEDLMLDLLGEEFKDVEDLSPVVTLDEFMKDLDTEPPFEDIVKSEKEEKSERGNEAKKEEGTEIEEREKEERESGEVMWEGVVQMNLSALASVAAFYKSGEKPPSMKAWPGFIEIKGRVRLDPFEKFLKDLPLSRSRAIMLTEIKWKEGSMESGRQNILETIESYISDARVGLAEPGPGVELYLCPSNEKMLELFTKLLPKDLSANLQLSKTSLIGVIVWRRPVLTTISPKLQNNNNNVKKENVGVSVRSSSFRERERNNSASKTVRNDSKNEDIDDDVPPGFGHMVAKNKEDDDLPEFDFRASGKNASVKPVQQMRDLIHKYGSSKSSSSSSGFRKNLSVETKSWNEDDDDIPEWNPNQDYQKSGNQVPNFEQQNVRNVYSSNNNGQFIVPSQQQMLQPPQNVQSVMPVQPNCQANYQVNNVNYQASNVNYQVNNSNNNQWWGQGSSSAQQQTQFGYRMPNQNWRGI